MEVRDRDTKAGEVKLSSTEALEHTESPPLTALKREWDNLLVRSQTAADTAACSPVVAQPLRSPGPQVPPVHPLQAAPLHPPCAPPAVLRVGHWGLGGSCRALGSILSCAGGAPQQSLCLALVLTLAPSFAVKTPFQTLQGCLLLLGLGISRDQGWILPSSHKSPGFVAHCESAGNREMMKKEFCPALHTRGRGARRSTEQKFKGDISVHFLNNLFVPTGVTFCASASTNAVPLPKIGAGLGNVTV